MKPKNLSQYKKHAMKDLKFKEEYDKLGVKRMKEVLEAIKTKQYLDEENDLWVVSINHVEKVLEENKSLAVFSPLEIAILKIAQKAGYKIIDRKNNRLRLQTDTSKSPSHGYQPYAFVNIFNSVKNGQEYFIDDILNIKEWKE